jgi:hypothetical protein
MSSGKRAVAAAVCGVVAAFIVIGVVEGIGHAVYAPADPVDVSTPEAMAAFVRTLPLGAFLFVLGGYVAGTFAGGFVATLVARRHAMVFASLVGALILVASVANFMTIRHPVWFVAATVVGVPFTAWLTGRAAARRLQPA